MVVKSWLPSLKHRMPRHLASPIIVVASDAARGVYVRGGSMMTAPHQASAAVAPPERSRLAPPGSVSKCSLRLKSLLFAIMLLVAIATLVAFAHTTSRHEDSQAGNHGD